jgi:hypothetical protein
MECGVSTTFVSRDQFLGFIIYDITKEQSWLLQHLPGAPRDVHWPGQHEHIYNMAVCLIPELLQYWTDKTTSCDKAQKQLTDDWFQSKYRWHIRRSATISSSSCTHARRYRKSSAHSRTHYEGIHEDVLPWHIVSENDILLAHFPMVCWYRHLILQHLRVSVWKVYRTISTACLWVGISSVPPWGLQCFEVGVI